MKKIKDILWHLAVQTPPRAYYSIFANACGLNVIRTIWFYTLWKLRKFTVNADHFDDRAKILERDGVLIVPNFLNEEDFNELKAQYDTADYTNAHSDKPHVTQYKYYTASETLRCHNSTVYKTLIQNKRLKSWIEVNARKKFHVFPGVTFEKFSADNEAQISKHSKDLSDVLHYDVPYNSYRAFLYMTDCDENNAAFIYGKKTQAFNTKRLRFEYYDSLKQSVKRKAVPDAPLDYMDEDLLEYIGHENTPMVGKANTLVIFNTMGMHSRGQFKKIGSRQAILIDFRTLDSKANLIFGFPLTKTFFQNLLRRRSNV